MTRSLWSGLVTPLAFIVIVLGGIALGAAEMTSSTPGDPMEVRPEVTDSPAALMEEHGCWTLEEGQPLDVWIPGHAVVSIDSVARYVGPRLTGKALEQEINGIDADMQVHGFCR